ncbi:hypothetical protein GI374_09780 [Paracoccus sp. S-4012]|uniref:hypothetical protein n=1 Tax=Paracoccus sp. S-4012 TaxID=2665648 RepID=UPI0012B03339|nr:hypothetical protein [Paracoccus sp. S-4012]MRX50729.1 hypothetical protein [Paracoccus sp. S-4012]
MRRALPLLLLLAACGDGRQGEDYPALLPLDQLLAEPALPPHAAADPDAVTRDLRAAQAGLQAATVAPPPVNGDLSARADALRDRAEAIRGGEVIDPATLARMRAATARQP